jgi:hypothetical protein
MVHVRFRNGNTAFSEHWIVQDLNNNATVLDRTMEPTETYPDPAAGGQWLSIASPNGT